MERKNKLGFVSTGLATLLNLLPVGCGTGDLNTLPELNPQPDKDKPSLVETRPEKRYEIYEGDLIKGKDYGLPGELHVDANVVKDPIAVVAGQGGSSPITVFTTSTMSRDNSINHFTLDFKDYNGFDLKEGESIDIEIPVAYVSLIGSEGGISGRASEFMGLLTGPESAQFNFYAVVRGGFSPNYVPENVDTNGISDVNSNGEELERLVSLGCDLERSDRFQVFQVSDEDEDGNVTLKKIDELQPNYQDPAAEGNYINFVIPEGSTNRYLVVGPSDVAGIARGTVIRSRNLKEITRMESPIEGYNPKECPSIYIVNPTREELDNSIFSVEARTD